MPNFLLVKTLQRRAKVIDVVVWQILQVVILARECGLRLELDDIKVQNLVPQPLQVRHLFASERNL